MMVRVSGRLRWLLSGSFGVSGAIGQLVGSGSPGIPAEVQCPSKGEWHCRVHPPKSHLGGQPTAQRGEMFPHPENVVTGNQVSRKGRKKKRLT